VTVGVIAASMSWRAATEADAMRAWAEVPATIKQADLKVDIRHDHGYRGRNDFRRRSKRIYRLIALYEYEFGGRGFTGDRLSLYGNSETRKNNMSTFFRNAYFELRRHQSSGKPFRCFVNPQRPSESVLYREMLWTTAAGYTLFATLFGSIGFGILTGVLASAWKRLRRSAAEVRSHVQSGGVALSVLAVLVVWWTIAIFPLVSRLPEILASGGLFAWTTLVFPLVGIVLLLAFAYQVMRRLTDTSHSALPKPGRAKTPRFFRP
jgi:hypothetical protein